MSRIYTVNSFSGVARGANTTSAGAAETFVLKLTRSLRVKDSAFIGSTGTWFQGLNGNRAWDAPGGDAVVGWGDSSDIPVVGKW